MRRLRGAFAVGIAAARAAHSDEEMVSALGSLEIPLERARGRIEPRKLLAYTRSESPRVRRAVARLLSYFGQREAEEALERLLVDEAREVRAEAVEGLLRVAGVARTAKLLTSDDEDIVEHFIELLEYERVSPALVEVLERFAEHSSHRVRGSARAVMRSLLANPDT